MTRRRTFSWLGRNELLLSSSTPEAPHSSEQLTSGKVLAQGIEIGISEVGRQGWKQAASQPQGCRRRSVPNDTTEGLLIVADISFVPIAEFCIMRCLGSALRWMSSSFMAFHCQLRVPTDLEPIDAVIPVHRKCPPHGVHLSKMRAVSNQSARWIG